MIMKQEYIRPMAELIACESLCSGGLNVASVINGSTNETIDHFDVHGSEGTSTEDQPNWDDSNAWGGD